MAVSISAPKVTDEQFQNAIDQLGRFVAIPCVSNPGSSDYCMETLIKAANFATEGLQELDFTVRQVRINDSAPFVVAEKVVDAAKPTITLYSHYDVQPVDRNEWKSDPFVVEIRDGRLYGRGASDDKGGVIAILTALRVYKEADQELPVNVRILFEGEEEFGSVNMTEFLKQEAASVQSKALVILDGMNRDTKTGTLTSSTRGIVNVHLKVNALEQPVHSGVNGLVPDPAQALVALLTSLQEPSFQAQLTEGSRALTEAEKQLLKVSSVSPEQYAKDSGMLPGIQLRGDSERSIYERIVNEPSLSIVNMTCGQPNGGNSIQAHASCTIGIRLLPGQDPKVMGDMLIGHLKSQTVMWNLPIETKIPEAGAFAWGANLEGAFTQAYYTALKGSFEQAAFMPCGGALPLIHEFETAFPGMEIVVSAVEDPLTAAHSHNESQHLGVFRNSVDSLVKFLEEAGKL